MKQQIQTNDIRKLNREQRGKLIFERGSNNSLFNVEEFRNFITRKGVQKFRKIS